MGKAVLQEISERIEFYNKRELHYKKLCAKYPNDNDFKREMYGEACKIHALKWVLNHIKNN